MSSSQIVTSAITVMFPAVMIFAGIMDLLTLKIRNILVSGIAVVYFVAAPIVGLSLAEIGLNVAVAAFSSSRSAFSLPAGSAGAMPSSRRRPRCGSAGIMSCHI